MLTIGWFSTARGESSRKLLKTIYESIQKKELQADFAFVFCSRETGESEKTDIFLDQVKDYRLPLVSLSVKKFADAYHQKIAITDESFPEWRSAYDKKVMSLLAAFDVDICLLAGYMLIVGPEMCNKYNMINLHPALPTGPKGTWQEVIWQLIAEKATESGVMMHLVTPELDRGPVISYCRYPIIGASFDELWKEFEGKPIDMIKKEQGENNKLFTCIRQAGFARETPLIIQTLKSFSKSIIKIDKNKRLIDNRGNYIDGYDLTAEINRVISSY